jgi:hypothetical protein
MTKKSFCDLSIILYDTTGSEKWRLHYDVVSSGSILGPLRQLAPK